MNPTILKTTLSTIAQREDPARPHQGPDRGMQLAHSEGTGPVWDQAPYARLNAGEYQARVVECKIYWDKRFRRWTCRLKF
jgi:hypothetical protein